MPQATDKNYHVQAVKRMEGDEAFYGFGDKAGVLNKKNYDYEMWNTDNPAAHTEAFKALYKSIPFFITLRESCVYGLFLIIPVRLILIWQKKIRNTISLAQTVAIWITILLPGIICRRL